MINIKISVHPFGRKLEWRGWWWGTRPPLEPPTTNAHIV